MRRKTRSQIPESAFIPKPARVMAILQLCIAFTLLFWVASWPFMEGTLEHKSRTFLFQTVMGGGDLIGRTYSTQPDVLQKIERNRLKFDNLPGTEKNYLIDAYQSLQKVEFEKDFTTKVGIGARRLLFETSPWFRAWLFFALIGAVLLLKKSVGAPYALWILPLVVLVWWIETSRIEVTPSVDSTLYPTEKYLLAHYGGSKEAHTLLEEYTQLENSWDRYLAAEWSQSGDSEEGEWQFQKERLRLHLTDKKNREAPVSGLLLCLFLIWNFCFAWVAYRWRALPVEYPASTGLRDQNSALT